MEKFWKYKLDHVLFWSITIGFHIYTRIGLAGDRSWSLFLSEVIVRNVLLAVIIYTNLRILIPFFAQRRQIFLYSLGLLASFGFYILAKNMHDVWQATLLGTTTSFWKYSFYNFSIALFYMAFSLALELSKQWYFQRERLRQVEVEKLNTELDYLKSQINPHFLFNSINTIYFQIDKQNATARESLSRFSEMLRYQLYECGGNEIPIEKEIFYLENYVELQRMRKEDNYSIKFSKGDSVFGFTIAPLLMITFVENAFKHASTHSDKENYIFIELKRLDNEFSFRVNNSKDLLHKVVENGGIGLKNVKRRLDLLYPNRHHLNIVETNESFDVELNLQIEENSRV
jgi:LytS/YehU family sensor histidine kinase